MMQFASAGFWGRGLYFAAEAGYSHEYATRGENSAAVNRFEDDEREMMLVSLLTGRVATMGRDNTLIVPPFLNAAKSSYMGKSGEHARYTGGSGERFNTVSGYTGGGKNHDGPACKDRHPWSKVWVVYENGRAYPTHVVRYYLGKRDPERTPYASREEAAGAKQRADTNRLSKIGDTNRLSKISFTSSSESKGRSELAVDNPMHDDGME